MKWVRGRESIMRMTERDSLELERGGRGERRKNRKSKLNMLAATTAPSGPRVGPCPLALSPQHPSPRLLPAPASRPLPAHLTGPPHFFSPLSIKTPDAFFQVDAELDCLGNPSFSSLWCVRSPALTWLRLSYLLSFPIPQQAQFPLLTFCLVAG